MALTKIKTSGIADNAITNAKMADDAIDSADFANASIDNVHVATGLDAVKLADGTVTNAEFQYINTLSSNAQTQIGTKSPIASPTFTGTPAVPTASASTNTTQVASTAFVRTEVANLVDSAPGSLDTLNELAAALGDDASFSTTVTNSIALKAPIASPTFTGNFTSVGIDDNADATALTLGSDESATFAGNIVGNARLQIAKDGDAEFVGEIFNGHSTGHGLKIRGGSTSSHYALYVANHNQTSSLFQVLGDGKVEIGGELHIPEHIKHVGDTDTYIRFIDGGVAFSCDNTTPLVLDATSGTGMAVGGNATFASAVTINGGGDCLTLNGGNATMVLVSASNDWSRIKFHPDNASSSKQWLIGAHKDLPYQFLFQNALGTTLSLDGNAHIATFAGSVDISTTLTTDGKAGINTQDGWFNDDYALHVYGGADGDGSIALGDFGSASNSKSTWGTLLHQTSNGFDIECRRGNETVRFINSGGTKATLTSNGDWTVNGAIAGTSYSGTSGTFSGDVSTTNIALGYNQTATTLIRKSFATSHASGNVNSEISMVLSDGSDGAVRIKNTRTGSYNSQSIHFDVHEGGVAARANTMVINYTGLISGDFNDTSDVALKENIQTISSGLSIVNALNPVTFDWKDESKGSNSGFIAQEVEEVLSNDVSGEDYDELNDGSVGKAINVTGIVAHLTKAIQELSAKVTALENA